MMKKTLLLFLLPLSIFGQDYTPSQMDALPNALNESSGLIVYNGKKITLTDSGGKAALYEINNSGNLVKTVYIGNATNKDWEALAQDQTHIYIGDFGNNSGNRTDLKIYKISKSDYDTKDTVTASIIAFSYQDQSHFNPAPNQTNFDAEALIATNDSLYIFSKNWLNFKSNVYVLPKTAGTFSALKRNTLNTNYLVTGADFHQNHVVLCGYTLGKAQLSSFLFQDLKNPQLTFYTNGINISGSYQVEGVAQADTLFFTSEGNSSGAAQLYQLYYPLSVEKNTNSNQAVFYPNPSNGILKCPELVTNVEVYNTKGQLVLAKKEVKKIDLTAFEKGMYWIHYQINQQNFNQSILVN